MTSTIIIICGPTASGKSARAIDIAQSVRGVIINADAMQVYSELSILTARPTCEEEERVPHRLYGILPASDSSSAAHWLTLARGAIDEAFSTGQCPIITGGTGLYIKSLMEGLSPIPAIPDIIRAQATTLWQNQGAEALKERDPLMSARLKPGDTQRHIRALEVMLATGKSLLYWQEQPRLPYYPHVEFKVEYIDIPRAQLYERCNQRFIKMLEKGALEEVKALRALELSSSLPAMRAVGVCELMGFLQGTWDKQEAITRAQQATRNYAKRQITWFKHQLKKS